MFRLLKHVPPSWRAALARRLPRSLHDTYVFVRDRARGDIKRDLELDIDADLDLVIEPGRGYDLVLLCPNYPSETDAQSNGGEFVRTRVGAYCKHGLNVLVVEVSTRNTTLVIEQHAAHPVVRLHPRRLDELLGAVANACRTVAVHVVTPATAEALARHIAPQRVAYFFHGSEIRDYRRLYFNYDTADMETHRRARDATHAARMETARKLIGDGRSAMVFVSRYLQSMAERDTGLPIPQATVIPNFIDSDFYVYRAKLANDARRVLLIRSFDAANYAADIAVDAIVHLLQSPLGESLHFTVCGFGRHFRRLTLPLTGYRNVTLREGVLSRDEMRILHAHHGIFLAPSRHDTQGVTMCEAMASGLVPVTHRVGGIPEFVDPDCGAIAADHTPREFARCIAELAQDLEGFERKSTLAARRVRERCGMHATIERELAVIAQCLGADHAVASAQVLRMTDVTVLADASDAHVANLARAGAVLEVRGENLRFEVALPALESCRYAYTEGAEARAWLAIARALGERFAPGSVLLIRADDPLLPLALMLKKHFGIDYALCDLTPAAATGTPAVAVLSSALAVVLAPGVEAASVAAKYVGPLPMLAAPLTPDALLNLARDASQVIARAATEPRRDCTRILLVAYYAGDCKSVGALRPNYWFEEFDRLSGGRTETHLATAMRPTQAHARLHYVPDLNGITLTDAEDLRARWVSEFVKTEQERVKHSNTLGYYWRVALERYFQNLALEFDAVIISGNPFANFDFAAFAQARWGARVVLDYRDPFALNPRFKYSAEARSSVTSIEAGYNFQADLILAVNNECAQLVVGHEEHRTAVVPNGFDDRIAATVTPAALGDGRINFVHAGSFYYYGNVDDLLGALDPRRHCLHHVGRAPEFAPAMLESGRLQLHGLQPYPTALSIVAGADCGLVFLTDSGFESTTKIFDYLCFDLDVLVLSPDDTPRGPLAEFGAAGGKLHWVKNTPEALSRFLASYTPSPRRAGFGERYSRATSARHLLGLLGVSGDGAQ